MKSAAFLALLSTARALHFYAGCSLCYTQGTNTFRLTDKTADFEAPGSYSRKRGAEYFMQDGYGRDVIDSQSHEWTMSLSDAQRVLAICQAEADEWQKRDGYENKAVFVSNLFAMPNSAAWSLKVTIRVNGESIVVDSKEKVQRVVAARIGEPTRPFTGRSFGGIPDSADRRDLTPEQLIARGMGRIQAGLMASQDQHPEEKDAEVSQEDIQNLVNQCRTQ